MMKKIVFISGASKGIGNEVARQLALHDFTILIGARNTQQGEAARIINVSSTLSSLTCLSNPENFFYGVNSLAYNSSKTALNALTVSLAKDLVDDNISINSICPGWVKTDMGTDAAPRTVQQGAAIIVKMATIENSPTGKFVDDNEEIPW